VLKEEAYDSGDHTFDKLKALIQINDDLGSSEWSGLWWRRLLVCLRLGNPRLETLLLSGLDFSSIPVCRFACLGLSRTHDQVHRGTILKVT